MTHEKLLLSQCIRFLVAFNTPVPWNPNNGYLVLCDKDEKAFRKFSSNFSLIWWLARAFTDYRLIISAYKDFLTSVACSAGIILYYVLLLGIS